MKDITTQDDVKQLIDTFYGKVRADETIGFIFKEIIGDNWDHHLPTMYKFWDMVLLSKPGYEGYPTRKHMDVDRRIRLEPHHFEQWMLLWNETVDNLFEGATATQAKDKAQLMATLISVKLDDSRKGTLIQ